MNNVRKAFQTKSLLRRMADGGIFKSVVNGVPTFTDKDRAAPDAEAYVPMAMRELPNTGIVPGGTALPQAPTAPMPAPAKLSPAPAPATTPRGAIPTAGYIAATGGFGPTTVPERRPRAIGGIGANRAEIGANRAEIGASRPTIGAMGLPIMTSVGYASGGEVKGPGGPTDDKVGPVMLSDGEYVLPADTVRAVGKENLDKLKDATHTPVSVKQRRGLRRMADGGAPLLDNELARIQQHRRRNPEYYIPKQQVIERTPVPVEAAMPVRSVGVIPPPPDVLSVDKAALADKLARSQTPTADMVRSGTPGRQPMPEQRPSEILSGQVNTGVMRDFAPAPAPAPPPAAKLSVKPRNVNVDMAAAFARGTAPASTPEAAATPAAPNAEELYRASGNAGSTPASPDTTAAPAGPDSLPPTAWEDGDEALTGLTERQSDELRRQGVSMNTQYTRPREMKFGDPVDRGAIDRPMVATGEKQINSKFYRDANGAVKEGTATLFRPATEEDINKMPLNIGPRAFANLTLREGTTPGQQVNLGNGMFGTSSKPGGPIDTFTGVGKDFNADSMRFGPDPEGKDRARQDAMVERNLQAKPREAAAVALRSNERGINSRFDALAEAARKQFSSPRAAGNLAKHLERIESQRMQALAQDADNMTRQQQIAATAATNERDIASRAATAARADETDRLAIGAQDRRAADAASAESAYREESALRSEWQTMVRAKKFSGDFPAFVAQYGKRGGSGYTGGGRIDPKDAKAIDTQAEKLYPDDILARGAIIANKGLMYGDPVAAAVTQGPVLAELAQKLGRNDFGEFKGFTDSTGAERVASLDGFANLGLDALMEKLKGGEFSMHFISPSGEPIYAAVDSVSDKVRRHFLALAQARKKEEEARNQRKERD